MQTKRPFFVYGTLLPNQPNHYLLEQAVVKMEPAIILDCQLYDMGPYPMLVAQRSAQTVGMLLTIADAAYDQVLRRVDALEGYDAALPTGCAYQRVLREVRVENGRLVPAWTYLGDRKYVTEMPPISSGDWANHMKAKHHHISQWWDTVETVAGLHEAAIRSNNSKHHDSDI